MRQIQGDPLGKRPAFLKYSTAVVAALFGLLLRYAVGPELGIAAPYLTFFPFVILSAWYGGFGAGAVTTALSVLFNVYFFLPHPWGAQAWGLGRFLIGSISFSWLIPTLLDVQRRARAHERWAAVTLASIGDAVLATDKRGKITFMNAAAATLTGWDPQEAQGRDAGEVFRVYEEGSNAPVESPIERVLREGVVTGLANHTVLESRTGEKIPIADSGSPIKDDKGAITGVVLIFRDIRKARTAEIERAAAEEQLARSEKRLSRILESISDGFVALDRDWRYTYVNAEAARLARMSPGEMIGKSIWELFPQEAGGPLDEGLHRSMSDQVPVTLETLSTDRNRTLRLRAYPSESAITIYIVDITREKEAAAATSLLAAIVASSSDAIISQDLEGRVTTWNKGAERIFGYTAAEMVGQGVDRLAAPGRIYEAPTVLERILRGEVVEPYETVRQAKDGRLVDIALSISLVRDAEGRVIGASRVSRDITDRKAAERALRNSEMRLSMALDAGSMGVWEWNIHSGRVALSPQVEKMHGIEPGTFGGTFDDFLQCMQASDRQRVMADMRAALEARSECRTEYRVLRQGRGAVWVEARGSITCDESGAPQSMLAVCMDVTIRKTTEEVLVQQADKLARTNADLKDFTYAASHDLQEPLRNVSTFAQLLSKRYKGKINGDADELIAFVVESALRMGNLIHDLLDYSRIVNSADRPATDVALNDSVEGALRNVRASVDESGASIEVGTLPTVRGDRVELAQLFQNLIGNAIKYRGKEAPRISISAEQLAGEWVVSVHDNGLGIDPKYHERIFGVFKRLHGLEYPGTGVGLAICKRIVEKHGGRVWVESAKGQGSNFRFTLPVAVTN